MLNDVGTANPSELGGVGGGDGRSYPHYGDPTGPNTCVLNYDVMPCDYVMKVVRRDHFQSLLATVSSRIGGPVSDQHTSTQYNGNSILTSSTFSQDPKTGNYTASVTVAPGPEVLNIETVGHSMSWLDMRPTQQLSVFQQTSTLLPGNLAQNVANLLTGDCGDFVKSLYATVAGKYSQHEPHSKDFNLLDVFNTINGRPGAIVFQQVFLIGKTAAGTVTGAIGNSKYPATIMISPIPDSRTTAGRRWTEWSYAITAIHETFHLAGTDGGYDDKEMAQAVFMLTRTPGLPNDKADAYEWSKYWGDVLRSKCPEKRN